MENPKPYLKWAGGKRRLVQHINSLLDPFSGDFYEPFIGGGAVFFSRPQNMTVISDRNWRLIETYTTVRRRPNEVVNELQRLRDDKATYLKLRAKLSAGLSGVPLAVAMIFLNRTCYNGLYRESRSGAFNTPYADEKQGQRRIVDAANLLACADWLLCCAIRNSDFESILEQARAGDAAYCDPPYIPLGADSFVQYTKDGFSLKDHVRLRDAALRAKDRGVRVVLSNSAAPLVEQLYGKHFTLVPIQVARAINSNGANRKPVREYLIY